MQLLTTFFLGNFGESLIIRTDFVLFRIWRINSDQFRSLNCFLFGIPKDWVHCNVQNSRLFGLYSNYVFKFWLRPLMEQFLYSTSI